MNNTETIHTPSERELVLDRLVMVAIGLPLIVGLIIAMIPGPGQHPVIPSGLAEILVGIYVAYALPLTLIWAIHGERRQRASAANRASQFDAPVA